MSYIPMRDNPDIDDRLTERQQSLIRELSIHIDEISAHGLHKDACGCTDEACPHLDRYKAMREAGSEETIAWLVAKGVLDLSLAWEEIR